MKILIREKENIKPYWWVGFVYFDVARREVVYALFGLHWVLLVLFWLWASYNQLRMRRSWVDRKMEEAYREGRRDAGR